MSISFFFIDFTVISSIYENSITGHVTDICGGKRGHVITNGHDTRHALQMAFHKLARRADRLKSETIDVMNIIVSTYIPVM